MVNVLMTNSNTISYYNGQKYNSILELAEKGKMHGAKRVLFFCVMTAILPTILIIIPLYLRHQVFADVIYPVAESDVLVITEGVSSIFCESLGLKMNSTFNAFQLPNKPNKSEKVKHIRLKKSMSLPDDTLEYWGFYLLKGSKVKLKICSRYVGARILVVRGDKNLNTCNIMKQNGKYGAKMDADSNKVIVSYQNEKPADFVGIIPNNDLEEEYNKAEEDMSDDNNGYGDLSLTRVRRKKSSHMNQYYEAQENDTYQQIGRVPKLRHSRKHLKEWQKKIDKLRRNLEENSIDRQKRSISALDAHIKHGGNAMNASGLDVEESEMSVSSFETELLTCYDGKILLSRSFQPSRNCKNIEYLDESNRMITEHTIASDGYYYYIFYSDNDITINMMHAVFDIYKTTYGFKNATSSKECVNKTVCEFPIHLLSTEIFVVEVPTRDGIEHEEDDITLLTSTCKPRMQVYVIFPILVLILIVVCAFL
ncbi:uncharacterized protein LOC130449224 isoform X1 [Diorhabda sublineata]|uniref:uncharacterized protein LOC130449224 isoform X1 n=2 Tax=Diorhabda sublineata TaxID=1163346 RepID=UPI0024E189A3|nr:uncharacterized protein LOC130449224 isoform X1 [Diorhabda sublineata]